MWYNLIIKEMRTKETHPRKTFRFVGDRKKHNNPYVKGRKNYEE